MVTRVSTAPVNYRDGVGRWRPVDPRLVARDDAFVNRGAAFSLSLPRRLSDGVAMSSGSDRLHMRLHGAGGTAAVSGVRATYAGVLPSVTAIYDSQAQGVREQLVIADRSAPRTFRFSLQASAGLTPRLHRDGSITLTRAGRTVFLLPPAVTFPKGDDGDFHAARSELRRAAGGWQLTVTPDRAWVLRELKHGPVVLDPTVEIDPDSQDCSMDSSNPTTSYCSSTHLPVGYEPGANAHEHRALVKFDLSVLPKDAVVLNADFGLTLGWHATNTLKQVGVYQAKRPWTNSATWNKYSSTSSWATAGAGGSADAEGSPAAVATTGDTSGFVNWYPTKLVQDWLDGAQPNHGFLIRDVNPGTVDNELDFSSREGGSVTPELDIVWAPRTGQIDSYTFESQELTDTSRLDVNVANGNLVLASHDLHVPGTGLDLDLTRFHNSMGTGWGDQAMGIPSTLSLGRDVKLQEFADGSVAFFRGDGVVLPFLNRSVSGATATFTAPSDLDASLSESTSTGIYTLTFNATQTRYIFDTDGRLTSVKDQNDHTISLAYHTTGFHGLSQITDTQGRAYAVGETPYDDFLSDITDPSSHVWNYTYGDYHEDYLIDYEDPAGNHTLYAYDASHRLIAITAPDGQVTKITYDGTSQRVASIKRTTDPGHTTGPTTTFTYSSPTSPCQSTNFDYIKTVVHRPDNSTTTYCANDHDQITYDTDNPTAATPSGEWYDLRDDYTQGTGTHSITLAGADAGAGVKKLALEEVGGAEIAAVTLPCDPRNRMTPTACPHTVTRAVTFDPGGLSAGKHSFRQRTTDYAGNALVSQTWTVIIDRTAPGAPSNFQASLDASTSETSVSWDDGIDPVLPDGTPGSGTASYEYRYARGTGPWSQWATTEYGGFTLPNSFAGEAISVEVRPVDAVGNEGATTPATLTAVVPSLDTTAPSLSLSDIEAGYGGVDNQTLIIWKAGEDPDFADGTSSTGVAGYNVRYQLDGGAWTPWSTVPSARILLSGGHAGQVIGVQVSAYDGAGNTSSVQSATTTSVNYTGAAGTLACWPSDDGIPPDCNDPADLNEDGGGPAATLVPESSSNRVAAAAATDLDRYRIRVKGLWTTARLRPRSFVVGNVKDGWTLDRVGEAAAGYVFGTIRGAFQGCGWIRSDFASGPYAQNGTSNCTNLGDVGLPKLATIALQSNPLRTTGSDTKLKPTQVNGVKFCAYITPWPGVTNRGHQCGGAYKKITFAQVSAPGGYHVKWRYVTLDGKWVLVQDSDADHHNDGYATVNWWFVRRSAFDVLCTHPRLTDPPVVGPACAPTN